MDIRYRSRKFLLALAMFLAAVGFFAFERMTAQEFISYTEFVLASYLALNVGQKAVEKLKPS